MGCSANTVVIVLLIKCVRKPLGITDFRAYTVRSIRVYIIRCSRAAMVHTCGSWSSQGLRLFEGSICPDPLRHIEMEALTLLHCTVLPCAALYCTVLYSTALYSTEQYCTKT